VPKNPVVSQFLGPRGICAVLNSGYEWIMEYKGIRYSISAGITPLEWGVAIHPPDTAGAIEKTIKGTRQSAEQLALYMIDKWLKPKTRKTPQISN
jgi:hypothetical protein